MEGRSWIVPENNESERVDRFLARKLQRFFSRSQLKKVFEAGGVKVQGRVVTAHYLIKPLERVEIGDVQQEEDNTVAQDIPLDIIYEDKELILLNKPAGLVVHPAKGTKDGTLVNALLFHVKKLSSVGGTIRPGIVHRLDKDTSGILVVAKSDRVHAFLAEQFKDQTIQRIYRVVVRGVVQHEEGFCEEPVGRAFLNRKKIVVKPSGGKDAMTYFKVLRRFKDATLLELQLHTGRTHQIRVHMRHLGHPVLGDALYGVKSQWISRQAVHAFRLGFIHPRTEKEMMHEAPLPEDIEYLLKKLEEEG